MKKAIFLVLFNLIIIFFNYANEKIVDLKFKNEDEKRFYIVDENKNMEYGYYEGIFAFKSATTYDNTIERYNGKIDSLDLNMLFSTKINFRWSVFIGFYCHWNDGLLWI